MRCASSIHVACRWPRSSCADACMPPGLLHPLILLTLPTCILTPLLEVYIPLSPIYPCPFSLPPFLAPQSVHDSLLSGRPYLPDGLPLCLPSSALPPFLPFLLTPLSCPISPPIACPPLSAHQILGVRDCLLSGGPWCATAAAYLDLLAPREEAAGLGGEGGEEEQEERRRQVRGKNSWLGRGFGIGEALGRRVRCPPGFLMHMRVFELGWCPAQAWVC